MAYLPDQLQKFYNTSPMREGVLCWYPFEHDASVLDLSGGALTELLERSCKRVVAGNSELIIRNSQFDYVVVLDPPDFSAEALKAYCATLTPHGRLLLAFENPYALRYWSGKSSPVTNLSYSSLLGRDGRIGKAEMQIRLRNAGFGGQKWYYPLTDHWFAREVYSESYLPDEYLNQRFVPYMASDENLQFDERLLYREVIRGGAFEFMCGAYLVEARVNANDEPCVVDYAAVTAYREPAKRFATTVCNDGNAYKFPLHPEGVASLKKTQKNHENLTRLGVNVLQTRLENNVLMMPRVELPTLWDYWVRKLSNGTFDFDEMVQHFDRIRDAIYKASADGDCYWELVPANCFYDEQSSEMIFFDQEYYWEKASPDIAMVRALWALKYTSYFEADVHTPGWLEELKERYGLSEQWAELSDNANKDIYEEVFGAGMEILEKTGRLAAEIIDRKERQQREDKASKNRREKFRAVPEILRSMGYKRPIIYGYGRRGKDLEYIIKTAGMEAAAIVDQSHQEVARIECIPPDAGADAIIISVLESAEIAGELKAKTDLPVIILEELI